MIKCFVIDVIGEGSGFVVGAADMYFEVMWGGEYLGVGIEYEVSGVVEREMGLRFVG